MPAFPKGKVLLFCHDMSDVTSALHAVLARHRDRNDPIIIFTQTETETFSPDKYHEKHQSIHIPTDRIDENTCVTIAKLVDSEKPVRVYLPAFNAQYTCLALQVWEGVRRATHQICIGIGELDQPLTEVSAWFENENPPPHPPLSATRYLQFFRAASYSSELSGHALLITDPKNTLFPGIPVQKALGTPSSPKVSIIVRTAGRASLTNSLDSIMQQTWPSIEVVIVNIGASTLEKLLSTRWPELDFNVINHCGAGRSAAANLGLEAATGEFFVFLDDDDYLYPAHIAHLINGLQQAPDRLLAYGGIRIEFSDTLNQGRSPSLLDEPFSMERLRLRNYIPIHACLTRRRVIDLGIRFDTSLEKYEDWDFWLKIAEVSPFLHIPGAVGVYRVGNSSEIAKAPTAEVYRRWLERSGSGVLEKIADWALSENTPAARLLQQQLNSREALHTKELTLLQAKLREIQTSLDEDHNGYVSALNAAQQEITSLRSKLSQTRSDLTQAQEDISHAQHTISKSEQMVAGIQHELSTVYNSTSWKILAPARTAFTFLRFPKAFWLLTQAHGGGRRGMWQVANRAIRAIHRHGFGPVAARAYRMFFATTSAPALTTVALPIETRTKRSPITPPTVCIDIIVCIHNALDDVRHCLNSIIKFTATNYTLILVDDGSAKPTQDFVASFANEFRARHIRHEQASGYTCAANAGIRAGNNPFVVLLNSDTVVGPEWLERLYTCIESDQNLAIVGPLSNCASWQSIPEIESKTGGDWADNPLPEGISPDAMATRIARDSARIYPRLSFINGFCQMIRRQSLHEVGLLDEASFPQGYGEENDLCCRLRAAGWQLAVADDVWVFHAQSKSYSNERRMNLCAAASENLARKHGMHNIEAGARQCRENIALKGIRARTFNIHDRFECISSGKIHFAGKKILFLLPSADAGGGANVIISEARALIRMDVDVAVVNLEANRTLFEQNYGDSGVPVQYVTSPEEIPAIAQGYDAVIASIYFTVDWLKSIANTANSPILGYYVQDFEPSFFKPGSPGYKHAFTSYTALEKLICFCKTRWNRNIVLQETRVDCTVIGPSLDLDQFRPWDCQANDRIVIAAMIRPNSPYRSPALTMNILGDIENAFGEKVEIITFGVDVDDSAFLALRRDFSFKHLGKLNSQQLSEILNQSDIFVDFSTHQAMGLTGMEAMASHCAVILPKQGGAIELAEDQVSALFTDARNEEECRQALFRLIRDEALRNRIADNALQTVQAYYPERAALNMLQVLFMPTT
jgi:GT2 family glycosyltransferase